MGSVWERVQKNISGKPQRFWAVVNDRNSKDSMHHFHHENGQVLVDEAEVIERWKEGNWKGLDRTCHIVRWQRMMAS